MGTKIQIVLISVFGRQIEKKKKDAKS